MAGGTNGGHKRLTWIIFAVREQQIRQRMSKLSGARSRAAAFQCGLPEVNAVNGGKAGWLEASSGHGLVGVLVLVLQGTQSEQAMRCNKQGGHRGAKGCEWWASVARKVSSTESRAAVQQCRSIRVGAGAGAGTGARQGW